MFTNNKISLTKGTSFDDYAKKILGKTEETKTAKTEEIVKTASATETVKEAKKDEQKSSGQPQAEAKLVNHPKECECPEHKGTAAKKTDAEQSSGQPEAEAKLVNHPKKVEEKKTKKEDKKAEAHSFVKMAKLNDKTKAFLKAYWSNLYPAEYVEAMLANYN